MHTQTRQYKQLALGQRYQIQAFLGKGHFQKDIAAVIGSSEGTLSRKLSRNTAVKGYCSEIAHARAVNRRDRFKAGRQRC